MMSYIRQANSIYDQHSATFANVSAYVVMSGEDRVATVALKFPRDGAGRLTAYFHVVGLAMVRGFASGGGYDKRSAAVCDAVSKIVFSDDGYHEVENKYASIIKDALSVDGGEDWVRYLEKKGFTIFQAV